MNAPDDRDIANAALYLASAEAEFISGVCLDVDGDVVFRGVQTPCLR